MCELFGASLNRRVDLRKYLEEFYSHSVRHPHGWGLADGLDDLDSDVRIVKEAVCANESKLLPSVLSALAPQKSLLAHIRYATVGASGPQNCHPFTGRDASGRQWTLIHNGTVYSGMALTKYHELQEGETDSERVFLYLLDSVNAALAENPRLDSEGRFAAVDRTVHKLSPRNKLNLMIYDGEALYVHKNMEGTLSYKRTEDGVIFSTVALDSDGWEDFPMCRAMAFKCGEKLYEGEKHENVFVQTLNNITEFDAMNI